MKKAIILTGVATVIIAGLGATIDANAEPRGANRQQANHQQNRHYSRDNNHYDQLTRRERRRYDQQHSRNGRRALNNHYYGGGISFSSGRRYGHHSGGNLALGVGLGMLTYQLINSQPRYRHTYVQRPPQRQPVVYVERQPAQTSCLQEREYQTTVIIGGVERGAYGTACLQLDGSWKQGPLTVEPEYNR